MKQFYTLLSIGILWLLIPFTGKSQFSATSTSSGTVTVVNTANGLGWTNITNVQTQNDQYATSAISGANRFSHFLELRNWGFQTTNSALPNYIPSGAVINGIEVDIRYRKTGGGNIRDRAIYLLKASGQVGSNKARNNNWPTSVTTLRYGSNTDLWGTTWTAAELAASTFGVRIQVRNQGSRAAQAEIDHVSLVVYFNQAFFYSKSTGNLEDLATWGNTITGAGIAPANFTAAGQVFFLQNRSTATLTAPLTISGANSRLVVGDGSVATTLTIPANFPLTAGVNLATNSSLLINNSTNPTLLSLGTGTTVNFGATANQDVPEIAYHNLSLSGSGTKTIQPGPLLTVPVAGILNIGSGITLQNNGSNVAVGGLTGITNNGTATGTGRYIYSLTETNSSISGTGTYSNLEIDFTAANTLTITNPITITGTFFATEGMVANGTNLGMTAASLLSRRDGVLNNPVTSTGYDVQYLPYTTASPKTTGNELAGTIQNLQVATGTGLTITLNRNLTVTGNLAILSGTLDASTSNYNISVAGNWTKDGAFTPRSGTLSFVGSSAQTIGGTGTQNFYNLTVNKPANYLILNAPVAVSNTLGLTNGKIRSSTTNTLVIGANGTAIAGGNNQSYVIGPLGRSTGALTGSYFYPVGDVDYRPVTLGITQVALTTNTYTVHSVYGAPTTRTLPASLSRVSSVRHTLITSSNTLNLSLATITLSYGIDDGVTAPASLRLAHAQGSSWTNAGGSGTAPVQGTIAVLNLLSLGEFVLANTTNGLNTLPLTWLNFTGIRQGNEILLQWRTAQEVNTDYFSIERSTGDNKWIEIGSIQSNTANGQGEQYRFKDVRPFTGTALYRIRCTDHDGSVSYSKTIQVQSNLSGYQSLIIAPNPVQSGTITAHLKNEQVLNAREVQVQVFDRSGKLIFQEKRIPAAQMNIEAGFLQAGHYLLVLTAGDIRITEPFIHR